ncbi:MAG: hypothetical protein KAF91_32190 [Nostoc sp. TH1S01]|nr:hypothetical protein [Nostoc sp. TH1S01]
MAINKHVDFVTNFEGLYWDDTVKRWGKPEDLTGNTLRSFVGNIHTLRAAKRHVKKWSKYLPPKTEFVIVNKYALIPTISLYTK